MLVFELDDPAGAQRTLEQHLSAATLPALVATHPAGRRELLCAVIDRRRPGDPVELAAGARKVLEASLRAGPRRRQPQPAGASALRHSFHEARCALEATAFANGDAPEVASHRDLGAFTLLLSVQDDEALRLYCDSVLGPIENSDERYAASCCARSRRTSSATATGSARRATATATATRSATGSSGSRS